MRRQDGGQVNRLRCVTQRHGDAVNEVGMHGFVARVAGPALAAKGAYSGQLAM